MKTTNTSLKTVVKFLTPVPYFSTPQLAEKGLVIVDLKMLVAAQKTYDDTLSSMNDELVKLKKQYER